MRKPILLILLFTILVTAAACGNTNKPDGQTGSMGSNNNVPAPSPSIETAASVEPTSTPAPTPTPVPERTITVYYADTELSQLISEQSNAAASSDVELLENTLAALQQDGPAGTVNLWKPIPIESVKLSDGNVIIDIHLPDEARLGAPGEQMLLDSLGKTLFQFDFVKSYDLLVDGEALESLMGHFDLEHPAVRPTDN